MISQLATFVATVALAQSAPEEAAWLKSIPAEASIVARVRPLEKTRDDLVAMLKAMSPALAAQAEPALDQGLQMFAAQYGKDSTKTAFFTVFPLPKPGEEPAYAVLVKSKDYAAVVNELAQKETKPKPLSGGYDSFAAGDGKTYYSLKGNGFVAFGPNEALIKSMIKPSATLDAKFSDETRSDFFGGDVGLFVDVAAVQKQYGDQIEQMKGVAMGAIDQAGAQMGANVADGLKNLYGGVFDAIKSGDSLAMNFDFAGEGLTVGGRASVLASSAAAQRLTKAMTGTGEMLGRMPSTSSTYMYMDLTPQAMEGFQKFGLSMMQGAEKPSPEMEKALAMAREAAGNEVYAASSGNGAAKALNISIPSDPKKAVDASTLSMKAMANPDGFIKQITITPNVETYKGFTFNRANATMNFDKMAANFPGGVEALKKMTGGDTSTTWYGTDGKMVISATAKDFNEVKTQIDALAGGKGNLASVPAFEALRSKLPPKTTVLAMIHSQEFVKQLASQLNGMMQGGQLPVPSDMPKEPALFGGSVIASPKGYAFRFVLPSNNGPVLEKGLVPLIQNLGVNGRVNQ